MTASTIRLRPLLRATDFGDDVAEFDQHLSSYFVETSSFLDIVSDRADLILGEKGSGKSAIFRHLTDPHAEIDPLVDVDIVPAFNVQGTVIFRRLSSHGRLSEDAYRFIWFTFITAIIANHTIATYKEVVNVKPLQQLLQSADLLVEQPFASRLWDKIEGLIESISSRIEVEGQIEFAIPKLPIAARATGRLRPALDKVADHAEEIDLEQVLYLCNEVFSSLGRRCWILFDRLDEAFEHDRELESLALRGLLRAHLDVASFRFFLRTKLFLRNDVMHRITEVSGFVNATHLRRHHLRWDAESIVDLIARRIVSSDEITKFFEIESEDLRTQKSRMRICNLILPLAVAGIPLVQWFEENTTDPKGSLNPRNVITLLRFARQYQLDVYDRDDPEYNSALPLITAQAMQQGLVGLSNARLQDTVLAEFQPLRPIVERLQRKSAILSHREMAAIAQCEPDSPEYGNAVATLLAAGVLSKERKNGVTVSRLYRPALHMSRHQPELTDADRADLRELVDRAIRNTTRVKTTLLPMGRNERLFVYGYVSRVYPQYTAYSVPTNQSDVKRVILANASSGVVVPNETARRRSAKTRRRRQQRNKPLKGAARKSVS